MIYIKIHYDEALVIEGVLDLLFTSFEYGV